MHKTQVRSFLLHFIACRMPARNKYHPSRECLHVFYVGRLHARYTLDSILLYEEQNQMLGGGNERFIIPPTVFQQHPSNHGSINKPITAQHQPESSGSSVHQNEPPQGIFLCELHQQHSRAHRQHQALQETSPDFTLFVTVYNNYNCLICALSCTTPLPHPPPPLFPAHPVLRAAFVNEEFYVFTKQPCNILTLPIKFVLAFHCFCLHSVWLNMGSHPLKLQ